MSEEPGFRIKGRLYPLASGYKLGDPVLVEKVTGLTWMEYIERIRTADETAGDPIITVAQVAVAVKREHKDWSRQQVLGFVEDLDDDDVVLVFPETDVPESADPLATPVGPTTSEPSAPTSRSGSERRSAASNRKPSGVPASATSSPV